MKTEELISLGLSEEQAQKVLAINGKDINQFKSANDTAKAEIEGLREQLATANETIDGFKKLDVDGIRAAAKDWQKKYETETAALGEKLKSLSRDAAVRLAIAKENVHDDALTMAAIDTSKVTVGEDGSVMGLSEQMAQLRQEKPFLFKTGEKVQQYQPNGGNPQPVASDKMTDEQWWAAHQSKT